MTQPDSHDAIVADLPAREVTLLEDRARVVRRGVVELPAGFSRVRIEGVSPVLSDRTLAGAFEGGEAALVADLRVQRRLMVSFDEPGRPAEEAAAALEARLRELDRDIEQLETERVLLERHAAGFDQIATMTFTELSEDVSWGATPGEEWPDRLDRLRDAERSLRERLVSTSSAIEERRREHQRLQERMAQAQAAPEREWATIEVDVRVDRAGSYDLVVEYVVPSACWRPYHTARLISPGDDAAGALELATDACVWQSTGEDWDDVALVFSTERASLGAEPPVLGSDILRVQRKSDGVVVETREQEIQTVGLGADAHRAAVAADVPGIDDGGAALSLRARERSTVPADGRPHRVPLHTFTSEATVELVALPELVPCVLFKSVQENRGPGPILAGPVDLIRHSGLVGRTSVGFIAAGERFALGWGPEPDLRLKRDTEVTEDKSRLLSSWVERTHEIEVRLSNLGAREHTVRVTERVPVSEIEKVKIEVDAKKSTGGQEPDASGFITWQVKVPPRGHEKLTLRYTLKKHEDVVGI